MRTVLIHTTKTLVTFQLAGVPKFDQLMIDGTGRRTNKMEYVIIGFMIDNGLSVSLFLNQFYQRIEQLSHALKQSWTLSRKAGNWCCCGAEKQKAFTQTVLIFLQ
jgi:hypothetical protein